MTRLEKISQKLIKLIKENNQYMMANKGRKLTLEEESFICLGFTAGLSFQQSLDIESERTKSTSS